jgi:hypothetical protein
MGPKFLTMSKDRFKLQLTCCVDMVKTLNGFNVVCLNSSFFPFSVS